MKKNGPKIKIDNTANEKQDEELYKKEDILADSKSEYDDKYNKKKPMIIMKINCSLNLMKMKILKNIKMIN